MTTKVLPMCISLEEAADVMSRSVSTIRRRSRRHHPRRSVRLTRHPHPTRRLEAALRLVPDPRRCRPSRLAAAGGIDPPAG